MCFIALEGNKDPNPIYDELQDAFQELYNDLENLGLKKKIFQKANHLSSKRTWIIEKQVWSYWKIQMCY